MATYKAGIKFYEVPFSRSSRYNVMSIYSHGIKNLSEFIHKGYVYVSLRVLYNFRRFCYPY